MAEQGSYDEKHEFDKCLEFIAGTQLNLVIENEAKRMQQQRERVAKTEQELTDLMKKLKLEKKALCAVENRVSAFKRAASLLNPKF
ncbi:hypothetical protein V7S43_013061 [Phytophthora oleae]|uniref:Uncharacterized protein n=1 Tax=Phytophthora oleae TaxID=2107226 RepID=A0ABD3F8H5_9STRA